MEPTDPRDDLSDPVAEAVRHALALVGPAEAGWERVASEAPDEAG
jgi:hypothetical protein